MKGSRATLALSMMLAGLAAAAEPASTSPAIPLAPAAVSGVASPGAMPASSDASGPAATPLRALTPGSVADLADQHSGSLVPITEAYALSSGVTPLTPPLDLWERIRRGFAMRDLESELVRDRERWYVERPDYLLRMTERSSKYLFHIVEELERRNMPTELALLPFIESAFNPQAVSSAKAAGMWQFMPATGKYFELKQNVFRDDRRDVLASTRAALDYLQKLQALFGDWHLALAAYNWGEGSVGRAISKNQRAGLGVNYTDLSMPNETRYYVPKLQAVKNIVLGPSGTQLRLPDIPNHPFFQSVDIQRDIDVSLAARFAGVSLDEFKALNPSVNRPVILAAGTPQILLPWDNAAVFESKLKSHGAGQLATWTVWVAQSTMKPADVARRVGMSEAELRRVNDIPARVVIKAGSSLLVPRSARMENDVASKVADDGQLALAPEIVLQRHVIKAGRKESVATVAKRYGLTVQSVADWNKVKPGADFKPGQSLVVFLPIKPTRALAQTQKPAGKPTAGHKGKAVKVAKR